MNSIKKALHTVRNIRAVLRQAFNQAMRWRLLAFNAAALSGRVAIGQCAERLVMTHTPRLRQLLDEAAERIKRDGGIPHDEFWQQVTEESEASA